MADLTEQLARVKADAEAAAKKAAENDAALEASVADLTKQLEEAKAAADKAAKEATDLAEQLKAAQKAAEEAAKKEEPDGQLTATAKGLFSDVQVAVVLDDKGQIASLTVDASGETPGRGQRCMEEAFTSQFVGKTAPLMLGDGIDGVSGATFTSAAVVEAVNQACASK